MGWIGSITDQRWSQIIATISLIATAAFGILALVTNYRQEDRITRWGKIAAGGIIGSAILSILAGILQDRIQAASDHAAQNDRNIQSGRFDQQIRALSSLNEETSSLNRKNVSLLDAMEQSGKVQKRIISAQRILLGNAEKSMLLTTRLTGIEKSNTGVVLKSMWDESNRVEAGKASLMVNVDCDTADGQVAPAIFASGSSAVVAVGHSGDDSIDGISRSMFSYSPEFQYIETDEYQMTTWFRSFFSVLPDEIADPEVWRHAQASILVSGPVPTEMYKTKWSNEPPISLPKTSADGDVEVPCTASIMLFVNGRILFDGKSPISIETNNGSRTLTATFEGDFDGDQLPTYAGK
jgi:hypothetical protein